MRLLKIFILFITAVYSISVYAIHDDVTHLPGLGPVQQKQYAGYAVISAHKKLFYWFVASDKKNAPIVLWSNGGPGYSSLYGFFNDNGPYRVTDSLQLENRRHAWNHFANYLVIDQPVNVGLSDIKNNQFDQSRAQAIDGYEKALRWFLLHHPEYRHRAMYLAGESYAGTYLPLLAAQILKDNKHQRKINLRGIILISPWADPLPQQSMDSTYAFTHGFITLAQKQKLDLIFVQCKKLLNTKHYLKANTVCGNVGNQIQNFSQLPDLANTAYRTNTDNHIMDNYINQRAFLQAVHATQSLKFACFSNAVNQYFQKDIQKSVKKTYDTLLSHHIPILILSGLNDMKDTNFLGIHAFINKMQWPNKSAYLLAKTKTIIVRTKHGQLTIGYEKSGGELTWIKVLNAGHMVIHDQPSIDSIVKQFMSNHS